MHCLANGIFVPPISFENEHNSILHLLAQYLLKFVPIEDV